MNVEIQNLVEMVNRANASAVNATKSLAEINTRAVDKLAKQHLGLVSEALNGGVKQLELLRDPKGYKEYLTAQVELAQEGAEKVVAAARETLGVLNGVRDEVTACFVKGVEAVSADAKPVSAKKSAA